MSDMMKKINTVLCILIALVIVGQLYMIAFEPYYLMTETNEEYPQKFQDEGQLPHPYEIGLFEMIWLKFHSGAAMIGKQNYGGWGDNLATKIDELGLYKNADGTYKTYENDKGEMVPYRDGTDVFEKNSNFFVMGIVGITVLGLVVAIMTIFTRKSTVQFCFTLAWLAVSVWGLYNSNPILHNKDLVMPYALGTVLPTLQALTIVGCVLTALRAYPFVYTRYIAKKVKN